MAAITIAALDVLIAGHWFTSLFQSTPDLIALLDQVIRISLEELGQQDELDPLLNLLRLPVLHEPELQRSSPLNLERRVGLAAIVFPGADRGRPAGRAGWRPWLTPCWISTAAPPPTGRPSWQQNRRTPATTPMASLASSATLAARLLVVDDDPELREFLLGELATEGYGCEAVGSGQAALLALRRQDWDLVLLDWGLPDFSGVEVCERLRAGGDATPVLMLTAHDDVAERVRALDAGADDYLTKPFSIAELLARVRAQLRRSGLNGGEASSYSLADLSLDLLRR